MYINRIIKGLITPIVILLLLGSIIYLVAWPDSDNFNEELASIAEEASRMKDYIESEVLSDAEEISEQYFGLEEENAISADPPKEIDNYNFNEELPYQNSELPEQLFLVLEESYNDGTFNVSGIDSSLVEHGTLFLADLRDLSSLPVGSEVLFNFFGEQLEGRVNIQNKTEALGNPYTKILFNGSPNEDMYLNAYKGKKVTRGRIYTYNKSYVFEHNGDAGFILSLYEYKRLNDALFID